MVSIKIINFIVAAWFVLTENYQITPIVTWVEFSYPPNSKSLWVLFIYFKGPLRVNKNCF